MYSILRADTSGPTTRYLYSREGLEENVWRHTAVLDPIVSWVDKSLIPLAEKNGAELKLREVVKCVAELAEHSDIRYSDIDWLGLTLITADRFRESAAALAESTGDATQEILPALDRLRVILFEMHDKISLAVAEVLRESERYAA